MTHNYLSASPIVEIRKFLISEFHQTDIAALVTYPAQFDSKIPVVPVQQLPETAQLVGKSPFIVYESLPLPGAGEDFWVRCERAVFYIYGNDYNYVLATRSFLIDLFGRLDRSAAELNDFGSSDINFLVIGASSSQSSDGKVSDDGKYSALVEIEYDYTYGIDASGRFAF